WRALAGEALGAERLTCAIALAEFGVCAGADRKFQQRATGLLAAELSRQILPDGGHIGRNPQTLIDLLLDLLPLRQAYAARGVRPPEAVVISIDRMIPMLRLLLHGDGSLALFNGMGVAPLDRLAAILAHDEARGRPPINAPYSGYQRLEAEEALIIIDAGVPPPPVFSTGAHAGTLSFEYSLAGERIVVNCGAPAADHATARRLARATVAHSTLAIDDRSSCRIAASQGPQRWIAGQIVAGLSRVSVDRRQLQSGHALDLSHDGYVRDFGLRHERVLALSLDGARLVGEDRLVYVGDPSKEGAAREFVLRFHLHPDARLAHAAGGRKIHIALPSGAELVFEAKGVAAAIEESIFFAAPEGARKCGQIVVTGPATPQTNVRWSFKRVDASGESRAVSREADM
ncbi:MAG: heparinase II/III family protein, partial [Methylocystis sp.]|nr:heparinase II/III family protein [Methylocystis sp.]